MRRLLVVMGLLALMLVAAVPAWRDRMGRLESRVADIEQRLARVERALTDEGEPPVVWAWQVRSWCGPGAAVWDWRGRSEPAVLSCSSYARVAP